MQFAKAARFPSRDQQYGIYNFHREADLAEAAAVIAAEAAERPPVLILAGEDGCGRSYFLHAAAYRAEQAGRTVRIGELDLDGFEPGRRESLEQFATHQLAKRTRLERSRVGELVSALKPSLQASGPQLLGASLFSVAIGLDVPHDRAGAILKRAFEAPAGAAAERIEVLYDFFRPLTEAGRFVLHVHNRVSLPSTLLHQLMLCAKRFTNLVLSFSETEDTPADPLVPVGESVRIAFPELDVFEVRNLLERNFGDAAIGEELARILWHYGKGRPPRISNGVRKLIEGGLLQSTREGWRVRSDASEDELAQPFEAELYQRLDARLSALEPDDATRVLEFLQRAAVCGMDVPVGLLREQMGIPADENDRFVDSLDEAFDPESADSIFEDLEYRHPAFPSVASYRFSNAVWPTAICDHMAPAERQRTALAVASFVEPRLKERTRGAALLLYRLSEAMGSAPEAAFYAAEMRWWVGHEDADLFEELLKDGIARKRLDPDALWTELQRLWRRWPPYRSFAVLEAYASRPGGVPVGRLVGYWWLRSELLLALGRYEASLDAAETGLSLADSDAVEADFHTRAGIACRWLERWSDGIRSLEQALRLYGEETEDRRLQVASVHFCLGQIKHDIGDIEGARFHHLRALSLRQMKPAAGDADISFSLHALARLDQHDGDYATARSRYLNSLSIVRKAYGPKNKNVGTILHNLSGLDQEEGNYGAARSRLLKALAIYEETLGSSHPHLAVTLRRLAWLDYEEGDYLSARARSERALDVARNGVGSEHGDTTGAMATLAKASVALGEINQADELASSAAAIREELFGRDHIWTGFAVWSLAHVRRAQGRIAEARELYDWALRVYKAKLRADHPDTLKLEKEMAELEE